MNDASRKAQDHRVKHGKPPQRSKHWHRKAIEFAREHGLDVSDVLDMHDLQANLLEWDGAPVSEAEHYAWELVLHYMTPRAA